MAAVCTAAKVPTAAPEALARGDLGQPGQQQRRQERVGRALDAARATRKSPIDGASAAATRGRPRRRGSPCARRAGARGARRSCPTRAGTPRRARGRRGSRPRRRPSSRRRRRAAAGTARRSRRRRTARGSRRRTAGRVAEEMALRAQRRSRRHPRITPMPGPLLAVDAPSLLYRAFFALPKTITDADGQPVNALLGAARTSSCRRSRSTTRAPSCCASARRPRTTASSSTRPTTPTARRCPPSSCAQWADAPAFFARVRLEVLAPRDARGRRPARRARARSRPRPAGTALLFTGDRDMFQCVSDAVTVLLAGAARASPSSSTPPEVRERYGIAPEQVPDFIALRGDPSDGCPGAKGIGEKTARRAAAASTATSTRCSRCPSACARACASRSTTGATSCARSGRSRRCSRRASSARRTRRPTSRRAEAARKRSVWTVLRSVLRRGAAPDRELLRPNPHGRRSARCSDAFARRTTQPARRPSGESADGAGSTAVADAADDRTAVRDPDRATRPIVTADDHVDSTRNAALAGGAGVAADEAPDAITSDPERERVVETDRAPRRGRARSDRYRAHRPPRTGRRSRPRRRADGRARSRLVAEGLVAMRARQRARYGGISWGTAFFGLLCAVGLAAILTRHRRRRRRRDRPQRDQRRANTGNATPSASAARILLLAVLALAWYCGGYVAGRMARFDGARQGIGVWMWTLRRRRCARRRRGHRRHRSTTSLQPAQPAERRRSATRR